MELPPVNSSAASSPSSPSSRAGAASSLLDTRVLAAGSNLSARVESIAPIGAKMRAQLLAFYSQTQTSQSVAASGAGTEANKANATTNNSPATSSSSQQSLIKLLNKPELFAVQLSALGKRVLTFTEFPLTLKQKVPVFIRGDGQLQINAAAFNKTANDQLKTQKIAENISASTEARTKPPLNGLNSSVSTLNDGLRRYLPLQTKISHAFAQLQTLRNQLSSLNNENLADKTVNLNLADGKLTFNNSSTTSAQPLASSLDKLLSHALTLPPQISPGYLKSAMMNSGALLEAKMRTSAYSPLTSTGSVNSGPAPNIAQPTKDDLKAELLSLIQDIARVSPSSAHPASNKPSTSAIDKLLQSLFSSAPPIKPGLNNGVNMSQQAAAAGQRALPAVIAAFARIAGLQIQHLTQHLSHQDGLGQFSGTFLELPVKIGDHFYPLSLQIQEKIVEQRHQEDERKKDRKQDKERRKKWQVFMEFDLDEHGAFASEINVDDRRVSTRLWVQKESLWSASKNHLSKLQKDLEEAGIVVEHMSCQQGSAPEKKTHLRQSLVDVRT